MVTKKELYKSVHEGGIAAFGLTDLVDMAILENRPLYKYEVDKVDFGAKEVERIYEIKNNNVKHVKPEDRTSQG